LWKRLDRNLFRGSLRCFAFSSTEPSSLVKRSCFLVSLRPLGVFSASFCFRPSPRDCLPLSRALPHGPCHGVDLRACHVRRHASPRVASLLRSRQPDPSVSPPCVDFFRYLPTAAWATLPAPPPTHSWGAAGELSARNRTGGPPPILEAAGRARQPSGRAQSRRSAAGQHPNEYRRLLRQLLQDRFCVSNGRAQETAPRRSWARSTSVSDVPSSSTSWPTAERGDKGPPSGRPPSGGAAWGSFRNAPRWAWTSPRGGASSCRPIFNLLS